LRVPGKEEFTETIRYFNKQLQLHNVDVRLSTKVESISQLQSQFGPFDEVIVSTGVRPRNLNIPGADHPKVISYIDALYQRKPVGKRVAIIGAGGIGFDVATFLSHQNERSKTSLDVDAFLREWGVDKELQGRGGLTFESSTHSNSIDSNEQLQREIFLLQRKSSKFGENLGKTTGWIHRLELKHRDVKTIGGVTYEKVDDQGLHLSTKDGSKQVLEVDTVVVCAGQVSLRDLSDSFKKQQVQQNETQLRVHLIGGADVALELDAKRAIDQGCRLAAAL